MPERDPSPEERFAEVVETYGALLRAAIVRLAPKHLGIDFDDVEQEARLRLWRALEREREIDDLASYLYRVAATATIDAIRRVKARRETQWAETEEEAPVARLISPEPSPERAAAAREIADRAARELQRIPESRRRAVGLYLQGLGSGEIGRALGWTEAKARNLLYRGLEDLRRRLRAAGVVRDEGS